MELKKALKELVVYLALISALGKMHITWPIEKRGKMGID